MPKKSSVVTTVTALRKAVVKLRDQGQKIALVPTMGALHEGHLALVRQARKRAAGVVVSIFVNPKQFAPHEDFATYPRNIACDLEKLAPLGVSLIWAPGEEAMYPQGFSTAISPGGPALAGLEDTYRPHFFGGVATVVCKLLVQVGPDLAIFGEKDYQQLKVVTRMARDLDLRLSIVGIPTIREKDGLALSSRNIYLSAAERAVAPTLHRVLQESATAIAGGAGIAATLQRGRNEIARAGFKLDYLEARHADTLEPVADRQSGPLRLLVAARLGKTRLIDNLGV